MGLIHSEIPLVTKKTITVPSVAPTLYVLGDASNAVFVGDYETLHVNLGKNGANLHAGFLVTWFNRQATLTNLASNQLWNEMFAIAPIQSWANIDIPTKGNYCTIQTVGNGSGSAGFDVQIWGSQRHTRANYVHPNVNQLMSFNVVQAASTTVYAGDNNWWGMANVYVQVFGTLGTTAIQIDEINYSGAAGTLVRWDASTTYSEGLVDAFTRRAVVPFRGGYPQATVVTPGGVRTVVSINPVPA